MHHLIIYLNVVNFYINLQGEIPWLHKFVILDTQHRFKILKVLSISYLLRSKYKFEASFFFKNPLALVLLADTFR